MNHRLTVSGLEVEVRRKRIKNMYLTVLPPDGRVRVSAPLGTPDETIRVFVITKMGWIRKQIARFAAQPRQTAREYVSGESHYVWGRRYRMEVRHGRRNSVRIKGDKLILTVREAATARHRENVLTEWYRAQLKAKLPELVAKWEAIIGVRAGSVRVKNMRTRWGTCNTRDKRVWINLQLAKKPVECLEYIVVHELVHLLEKSHNAVFTGYMDRFMPHWRVLKDELNGSMLDPYT